MDILRMKLVYPRLRKICLIVALVLAPTMATADSSIVHPAEGYMATDLLSDEWINAYCVYGDNLAIYSNDGGLEIIDRDNPSVRQNWGKPSNYIGLYASAGLWPSFMTPDPSDNSIWVGFTMSNNSDDRIYKVDSNGGWTTPIATLPGNYDMDILNDNTYVSANPGAIEQSYASNNSIYLLDETGDNNHDLLAEVGGVSAGLGIDNLGNIYYGTYFMDGRDNIMIRYTASQIASAMGEGYLTLSNAETLFTLSAGANDVDVDDVGHLVFDVNNFSGGSTIYFWDDTMGSEPTLLAVPENPEPSSWFSLVEVEGDITAPGGTVDVVDHEKPGIAEIIKLIPGDANGDGTVDQCDAADLARHWRTQEDASWVNGDFNDDGAVDAADVSIMAANWGKSLWPTGEASPATGVPEPSLLVLLLTTSLMLIAKRRRD